MNASIKLIVIVRDPVTRLISDYAQLAENKARRSRKNISSFESLVLLPSGEVNIDYKPVKTSIYALYYWRWTQVSVCITFLLIIGNPLLTTLPLAPHVCSSVFECVCGHA